MDTTIIAIAFQLAILIFSVVIHEVSHGLTAHALGDPTAKDAGRLTLNPLHHLDPVGSVLVPLASFLLGGVIIGWARPVPYDPSRLRVSNQDVGSAIVGAAGPLANIVVALVFGSLVRTSGAWAESVGGAAGPLIEVMSAIVFINLVLAVFNFVPIPPLDGSKVLFSLLPARWFRVRMFLEQFGFVVLLLFIFYFSGLIRPIVSFLFQVIAGSGFP
jgi:Zn-dependent protease